MNCNYISGLANDIYVEIGSPSSTSVSFISGKLVSNSFLGQLGALTYKCYTNESGCINPALDAGEQAISFLLYLGDYYKKQVSNYLGAAGVKRVLSVREGDSSISLSNSATEAKLIRDLAKDYTEQAKEAADLYNRGLSNARQVQFYTIDQYSSANGSENQYGPQLGRQ
jgi:hypothetical protein